MRSSGSFQPLKTYIDSVEQLGATKIIWRGKYGAVVCLILGRMRFLSMKFYETNHQSITSSSFTLADPVVWLRSCRLRPLWLLPKNLLPLRVVADFSEFPWYLLWTGYGTFCSKRRFEDPCKNELRLYECFSVGQVRFERCGNVELIFLIFLPAIFWVAMRTETEILRGHV